MLCKSELGEARFQLIMQGLHDCVADNMWSQQQLVSLACFYTLPYVRL